MLIISNAMYQPTCFSRAALHSPNPFQITDQITTAENSTWCCINCWISIIINLPIIHIIESYHIDAIPQKAAKQTAYVLGFGLNVPIRLDRFCTVCSGCYFLIFTSKFNRSFTNSSYWKTILISLIKRRGAGGLAIPEIVRLVSRDK